MIASPSSIALGINIHKNNKGPPSLAKASCTRTIAQNSCSKHIKPTLRSWKKDVPSISFSVGDQGHLSQSLREIGLE